LLHGGHNLSKRERDRSGDLGVEVVRAAVGKVNFAVDDVGVRAGGGAVEGPLELAEGQGQATERDVALGTGIAQAPGFAGQMGRHSGQQVGLVEFKTLAQLQLERAAGKSWVRRAELEDCRGLAMKVGAFGC